jgi:hypothetical protein
MIVVKPSIPTMEMDRRMISGFLPPALSTQAPKGIRNSDPKSCGAPTKNPSNTPDNPSILLNCVATEPNSDTAEKPTKNPNVAIASPILGFPFKPYLRNKFCSFIFYCLLFYFSGECIRSSHVCEHIVRNSYCFEM